MKELPKKQKGQPDYGGQPLSGIYPGLPGYASERKTVMRLSAFADSSLVAEVGIGPTAFRV